MQHFWGVKQNMPHQSKIIFPILSWVPNENFIMYTALMKTVVLTLEVALVLEKWKSFHVCVWLEGLYCMLTTYMDNEVIAFSPYRTGKLAEIMLAAFYAIVNDMSSSLSQGKAPSLPIAA